MSIEPWHGGRWFVRTIDSTDPDVPVGAADGRAVVELEPAHREPA